MSFFKSEGPLVGVTDILRLNRDAGSALIHYHGAVMRQESQLTVRERELIAAYVSGLNSCQYCHGVHSVAAEAFGVPEGVLAALLVDVESAPVPIKLIPVLRYAKKLTLEPAKLSQADADAVFAAGWSEQALHDAVNVCALFNFMNRLVEGHGLRGGSALYAERGSLLAAEGYEPLLKVLDSSGS